MSNVFCPGCTCISVFAITMRDGSVDGDTSEIEVTAGLNGISISDGICGGTVGDHPCHAGNLKINFYGKESGEGMGYTAGSRCLGRSSAGGDESIMIEYG